MTTEGRRKATRRKADVGGRVLRRYSKKSSAVDNPAQQDGHFIPE